MKVNVVEAGEAPRPAGPYSAAMWTGDFLFMSGQVPIEPSSGRLVEGGITAQTERVFDNIEAVLSGAGLTLDDVVKTTAYLSSMDDLIRVNRVYESRFRAPYPSRSAVAVSGLPLGALIEIEAVAVKGRRD